jgi:amino acid transporter
MAGNAVWLAFVGGAAVATFTGLSYAELAAMIPRSGGEYHYVRRAFGGRLAFAVSWLLLVGLTIAAAAVPLGVRGLSARVGRGAAPGGGCDRDRRCRSTAWESVRVAALGTLLEVAVGSGVAPVCRGAVGRLRIN